MYNKPQDAMMQTQQALGMAEDMPAMGAEDQNSFEVMGANEDYDNDVRTNLEQHLNSIPDAQKAFLVENLNPTTIALLGIINGQEVYDYFAEIYQTQLSGITQQNSGSQPNMASQGAMPQGETQNPQAKATPAGQPVGPL